MPAQATTVLKKNKVRLVGTKQISRESIQPQAQAPPAKATIVSHEDGYAVIQVVCGCGQEIQLRCAYADGAAAGMEKSENNNQEQAE